ncbi:MAG: helix-turn-helix domain-containing protein, partial [Chloroflexales bacterium]|nr:helix-turn-helix domain-containing protein [Chloroflexales bacterium]
MIGVADEGRLRENGLAGDQAPAQGKAVARIRRLAGELLDRRRYIRRLHQRGLSATDFHLSLSRHEIGNYLGLAVETVSRIFTRFQEEGLLKFDRKHVQLLNLAGIEEVLGQAAPD